METENERWAVSEKGGERRTGEKWAEKEREIERDREKEIDRQTETGTGKEKQRRTDLGTDGLKQDDGLNFHFAILFQATCRDC
jgi:hypothetical protein